MNEMNHLEEQLLSWKPRPPSASLKQRLFGKTALALPTFPPFAVGRWLAPTMALFLVSLVYFGTGPQYLTQLEGSNSTSIMATVGLSKATLGACYASATPSERNVWSITSFDWTNTGQSVSTSDLGFRRGRWLP